MFQGCLLTGFNQGSKQDIFDCVYTYVVARMHAHGWNLNWALICRAVWPQTRVLLCAFHVKKSWALNLVTKISSKDSQEAIRKDLDRLMRFNPPPDPAKSDWELAREELDAFAQKYSQSCPVFVTYFKGNWATRPGKHLQAR